MKFGIDWSAYYAWGVSGMAVVGLASMGGSWAWFSARHRRLAAG
jgi:hypothetical protein